MTIHIQILTKKKEKSQTPPTSSCLPQDIFSIMCLMIYTWYITTQSSASTDILYTVQQEVQVHDMTKRESRVTRLNNVLAECDTLGTTASLALQ